MSALDFSGVHDFDFLHGKWRVRHHTLEARLVGATRWLEADATDIVRPAFAGLGNIGRFKRLVDGQPYEGVPIRLYDPSIGRWRIYWLDTSSQRMEPPVVGAFRHGVGRLEGDDLLAGRPIRVRFDWTDITSTTARWSQSYSADAGARWELNSVMEFTRDDSLPGEPEHHFAGGEK